MRKISGKKARTILEILVLLLVFGAMVGFKAKDSIKSLLNAPESEVATSKQTVQSKVNEKQDTSEDGTKSETQSDPMWPDEAEKHKVFKETCSYNEWNDSFNLFFKIEKPKVKKTVNGQGEKCYRYTIPVTIKNVSSTEKLNVEQFTSSFQLKIGAKVWNGHLKEQGKVVIGYDKTVKRNIIVEVALSGLTSSMNYKEYTLYCTYESFEDTMRYKIK